MDCTERILRLKVISSKTRARIDGWNTVWFKNVLSDAGIDPYDPVWLADPGWPPLMRLYCMTVKVHA